MLLFRADSYVTQTLDNHLYRTRRCRFLRRRRRGRTASEEAGTATQLIVDDKPLLILGGELGNSTTSDLKHLNTHWTTLKTIGLNTVIAPVEWDQIEPKEGVYDFTPVEGLIQQAEANKMKIVLLWFGPWKNSMSTYVPPYIKHDYETYAKAQDDKGVPVDILAPTMRIR